MRYTRGLTGERPEAAGYSAEAEEALTICEQVLAWLAHEPSSDGYAAVVERSRAIAPRSMTPYQRARLLGCEAEAVYFLEDWERALRIADEAISMANGIEVEAGREAEIARLRGELYRRRGEIQRRRDDWVGAAESYGQSIGALWRAAELEGWVSTGPLRDSLARCAGLELNLGLGEQAKMHLGMAERVQRHTRLDERGSTEDATTRWLRANLLHREGRLVDALIEAMSAADAFMAVGPDDSAARILSVVMDIVLDLAESYGPGSSARADYLRTAHTYHRLLVEHATRGEDRAGIALATLAEVRLNRLARPGYRMGVARLRRLLDRMLPGREWDWATICQTRVALGRELLARVARLEAAGGPANLREAGELRVEARSELALAVAEAWEHGSPGVAWWAMRVWETLV